jgi:hypothetical protein
MQRNKVIAWSIVALTVSLTCTYAMRHMISVRAAAAQSSTDHVIFLDQGWSKDVREGYYHISQGTTVMPYDIFLNLEAAGSQELFRSDTNSQRYGLTPDPAESRWPADRPG